MLSAACVDEEPAPAISAGLVPANVLSAFFEQLPGSAAIIDRAGVIVAANNEWRAGAPYPSGHGASTNYWRDCTAAAKRGCPEAERIGHAISVVLQRDVRTYRTVYSRRVDGRVLWYEVRVWRIAEPSFRGAGIRHEDVTDAHEAEQRARTLANTDPLTGLANRRALDEALQRLRGDAAPAETGLLLLVDLDDFKRINDEHGHDIGDRVLVIVARRLRHAVRAADTVARLGGDEFALLLMGAHTSPQRIDWIIHAIEAPIRLGGLTLEIRASCGVAPFAGAHPSLGDAYRQADRAMYRMKQGHRAALVASAPA